MGDHTSACLAIVHEHSCGDQAESSLTFCCLLVFARASHQQLKNPWINSTQALDTVVQERLHLYRVHMQHPQLFPPFKPTPYAFKSSFQPLKHQRNSVGLILENVWGCECFWRRKKCTWRDCFVEVTTALPLCFDIMLASCFIIAC